MERPTPTSWAAPRTGRGCRGSEPAARPRPAWGAFSVRGARVGRGRSAVMEPSTDGPSFYKRGGAGIQWGSSQARGAGGGHRLLTCNHRRCVDELLPHSPGDCRGGRERPARAPQPGRPPTWLSYSLSLGEQPRARAAIAAPGGGVGGGAPGGGASHQRPRVPVSSRVFQPPRAAAATGGVCLLGARCAGGSGASQGRDGGALQKPPRTVTRARYCPQWPPAASGVPQDGPPTPAYASSCLSPCALGAGAAAGGGAPSFSAHQRGSPTPLS